MMLTTDMQPFQAEIHLKVKPIKEGGGMAFVGTNRKEWHGKEIAIPDGKSCRSC